MAYALQIGAGSSQDRLEKLIEERLSPGSDKARIDQRIWDLFGEEWAVMFTDLSGFSRGVAEFGIIHFLQVIYESQRLLVPSIDKHDGILLKLEGDSMLVIFRNANKAIDCSIEMQQILKKYNTDKPETDKVLLCVGLGFGKLLKIGDSDVFGPEVNASSKLGEDTADAWEILVTENVKTAVKDSPYEFVKIKETPPGANAAFKLIYKL